MDCPTAHNYMGYFKGEAGYKGDQEAIACGRKGDKGHMYLMSQLAVTQQELYFYSKDVSLRVQRLERRFITVNRCGVKQN